MPQRYIGITLPIRLGQTGMFEQSTTVIDQVRSNFKNLVLTKKGERVHQPNFGCDLWKVLFEQITEETFEAARITIADAVDRWMPFIELTDFQITAAETQNSINIRCTYRFRNNPNVTDTIDITANTAEAVQLPFPSQPVNTTRRTMRGMR